MPVKTGSFQDLIAWQKSMDLAEAVYRLSAIFPVDERFGITSQIRRAVVSIPSNVAEGYGRQGGAEFRHFLRISLGSLREVQSLLILSERVGLLASASTELELANEVGAVLYRLEKSIVR